MCRHSTIMRTHTHSHAQRGAHTDRGSHAHGQTRCTTTLTRQEHIRVTLSSLVWMLHFTGCVGLRGRTIVICTCLRIQQVSWYLTYLVEMRNVGSRRAKPAICPAAIASRQYHPLLSGRTFTNFSMLNTHIAASPSFV